MTRKYPPLRPLTDHEQQLVLENTGLAMKEAWRVASAVAHVHHGYMTRQKHVKQYFNDLWDAAIIGLCVGVQRWEPGHDAKLGTYAYFWIRAFVGRASNHSLMRTRKSYASKGSRVRLFGELFKTGSMTGCERQNDEFNVWDSRDGPKDDEADKDFVGLQCLMQLVLNDRQFRMACRYVFDEKTLQEIGDEEGCTKENVRQVVGRALQNLRDSKGFMEAMEKRLHRRRQQLNADDFWRTNTAMLVA